MANISFNAKHGLSVGTTPPIPVVSDTGAVSATTLAASGTLFGTNYTATVDTGLLVANAIRLRNTSTNAPANLTLMPNGASVYSSFRLHNKDDVSGANMGALQLDVNGTAASLNGISAGNGVAPSTLSIGLTTTITQGLNVSGNVVVSGNLTINGTTTTINSTELIVDDINVVLGSVATPTDITANGGGITLLGATNKTITWDSTNANWTSSEHWNIATGKSFKINNVDVLSNTTLGSTVVASSLTSVGTITTGVWNATIIADGKIAAALTGKTYNGLTVTTTTGTFTLAAAKTLTVNNTMTFSGTDSTVITFPGVTSTLLYSGGALGTPSSGVATNLTGLASGLSIGGNAATVTTNANLYGDVTSVGNATTVVKINGTTMSTLGTGILKNTTGTGVPSIAIAADFPILNQNTTGNAATVTIAANRTDAAWYQALWGSGSNVYSSANVTILSSGLGAIGFNNSAWYIQGNSTYGLYSNTGLNANGGLWDVGNRVYSAGNPQVNISGNAGTVTNATFVRQFTMRDDRTDGNNYSEPARATGLYAIAGAGTNGPGFTYLSLLHISNSADVAFQVAGGYNSDNMYFRGTSSLATGTFYTPWRTVLHSGNYNSYSPTLTGTGASGTWGINVSGNAATATSAGILTGAANTNGADGWFRSTGAAGWYSTTYSVGIYSTQAAEVRTYNGSDFLVEGSNLSVGSGVTNSNIWMTDADEGTRRIHCNSNNIGFLTQAGNWGAYCTDDGSWYATNFSGSSTGTNTGDQTNISGNAGSASTVYQGTDPTAGTYRILLGNGGSGNASVYNKTSLYWNDTGSIIQGANISGNAATATTAAACSGTALYATSAGSAPASDVYAWAKAASKPTYTKSEVGLDSVDNTADASKSVSYATSAGNVTTNANLTGHVTSVGNATSLGSFTIAQLNQAVSDADVVTTLRGYLNGCELTWISATSIQVEVGACSNSSNIRLLNHSIAIAKTTASWAYGGPVGGLDAGTIAANTWYYFYVIRRPDDGHVDIAFSISPFSPTIGVHIPTQYTEYRYVGAVKTNASSQWVQFTQAGREFYWYTPVMDYTGVGSATATLMTISVPSGRKMKAFLHVASQGGVGQLSYVSNPSNQDLAPALTAVPLAEHGAGSGNTYSASTSCWTDAARQIRRREANTGTMYYVTLGWLDLAL